MQISFAPVAFALEIKLLMFEQKFGASEKRV